MLDSGVEKTLCMTLPATEAVWAGDSLTEARRASPPVGLLEEEVGPEESSRVEVRRRPRHLTEARPFVPHG